MTRDDIIQMRLQKVLSWDREDIRALSELLYDLYHSVRYQWHSGMDCWRDTGETLLDYLDPEQLPTCSDDGNDPTLNRVWARDKKGNCLISLDFETSNFGYNLNRLIRMAD